jgi:predicted dehydrogenase
MLQALPEVEVTSICGLGQEKLKSVQERFGIRFGTEDYRELLSHDRLDGVVVSSPHRFHFEHAGAALERGIHVLCEKPMALRASEANRLLDLVESRKLHFLIPYGWSYTDFAAFAREQVQGGRIGKIEHVQCYMATATRELFSGVGAWFTGEAFLKPETATWSDPVVGGGFAHGQLTHILGLLLWITELEPVEVFAFVGRSVTGADLSDSFACRFRGGITGAIGGTGALPPPSPHELDIRIFGSEGMLHLDIERPRLEVRRGDGHNYSLPMSIRPGFYACLEPLRVFVDLIRGKPVENRSPAWLGARVVGILDAGLRSVASGKPEIV